MQGKQFGSARALIEKQLAQRPDDPNLLMIAAQTYNAIGDAFEMEKAAEEHGGSRSAKPAGLRHAREDVLPARSARPRQRGSSKPTSIARPNSVPANTMLGTILRAAG